MMTITAKFNQYVRLEVFVERFIVQEYPRVSSSVVEPILEVTNTLHRTLDVLVACEHHESCVCSGFLEPWVRNVTQVVLVWHFVEVPVFLANGLHEVRDGSHGVVGGGGIAEGGMDEDL
jgi:hypothetical protein